MLPGWVVGHSFESRRFFLHFRRPAGFPAGRFFTPGEGSAYLGRAKTTRVSLSSGAPIWLPPVAMMARYWRPLIS